MSTSKSSSATAPVLISTTSDLAAFLAAIPSSGTLCVDLEGRSLSRNGTLSLLTVLVEPAAAAAGGLYIIDVLTLGNLAFTSPATNGGKTLKSILEDPSITKCFWDVRNDADALFALHGVGLAGVVDIQLLENASRIGDKKHLHGLDKSVQADAGLKFVELNRWIRTKKDIKNLMQRDVFSTRPVPEKVLQYCVNDVVHLPKLRSVYTARITPEWLSKAKVEATKRVAMAHSPGYDPQSPDKVLGPWGSTSRQLTLDEFLDMLEDERMDQMDDIDYYDEWYEDDF